MTELYIGLMSGTSLDAIDAALVRFGPNKQVELVATYSHPLAPQLKHSIVELMSPGPNAIYCLGKTDTELGLEFGQSCLHLLKNNSIAATSIKAIGSHGQTIRHAPNGEFPFTIQIGDPNVIATVTDITTIADFRRRDLAYGGQAAPLAPGFHQYYFSSQNQDRIIINIGGIANLTYLPKDPQKNVIGFDTGPGNTLIDVWCKQHTQKDFDRNGQWAAQGKVDRSLLGTLLREPFFKAKAPKSTGRELFNLNWLQPHLIKSYKPEDIQATLTELTAISITNAINSISDDTRIGIYLCGGGAHNGYLRQRLSELLANPVNTTTELGLAPDWVEAVTFAWLAKQTLNYETGNLPSVTGARRATILGAIYPVKPQ